MVRSHEWNCCTHPQLVRSRSFSRCLGSAFKTVFPKQSATISLDLTVTTRTSSRALHTCRKNAVNSVRLVLRIESVRGMILMAVVESQRSICVCNWFGSTVPRHPNFQKNNATTVSIPSLRKLQITQQPSQRVLSAIGDCSLLVAVLGHQLRFPRTHDAVPLSLCLSESQSEPLNAKTEAPRALFANPKKNCNCSTAITPRLPLKCLRIELMFCMYASLARPSLDVAFAIAHRKSVLSIHSSLQTSGRYTHGSD